eukprot:TRINITY_DN6544_c2_g1_i6.p1 TRINITY_DN6544_c2_g1~~TRINITY_DN6544_c2_g1_i6.p1  ORF type:complete len:194 (-),score=9.46 TRINITY_DN6544_c2_g1_i6:71-652(-)
MDSSRDQSTTSALELLPGQVPDQEDETPSTFEDDFDLEEFRRSTRLPTRRESQSQDEKITSKTQPQPKPSPAMRTIKFFGILFHYNYLLERNSNPILLLQWVMSLLVIGSIGFFLTFVVGQKFKLLPTILGITASLFAIVTMILLLQTSVKDGLKINNRLVVSSIISMISSTGAEIYAIGWAIPFESIPLYFL